jgi:hypothetical protein
LEIISEAIINGVIKLNESNFQFVHTLLFPLGEDEGIKELTYKARINDKMIAPHMRGVKSDDVDGRLNALIAALTNESRGVISSLDSADKRIATAIGIFFM